MHVSEILERLISFDSTSHRSNLDVVSWIEDYLGRYGLASHRIPSADKAKATLVAVIGPVRSGGVTLCGHLDTVPVEGQSWATEPFRLHERGGRYFGRGTVDMKGFIAATLAAVPDLIAASLSKPITIALTHDEETGCRAAASLGLYLSQPDRKPAFVIVGEPTSMEILTTHKSVRVLRTEVSGRAGHASRPERAASALRAAAQVVHVIDECAAEQRGDTGLRDSRFVPDTATFNVGVLNSGAAANSVPEQATLLWEMRCLPGQDPDALQRAVESRLAGQVLPPLRKQAAESSIVTSILADVPALEAPAEETVRRIGEVLGLPVAAHGVAFGTDGSWLQRAGLPTVVCGPGSIEQAHAPDEFIAQQQVDACGVALRRLVRWAEA